MGLLEIEILSSRNHFLFMSVLLLTLWGQEDIDTWAFEQRPCVTHVPLPAAVTLFGLILEGVAVVRYRRVTSQ